ncbi:MAG: CHAT domain-containing protein [Desulfobacterales bacterium]|nr:CHAT domain-containing protein [Desulfobacterales bacterium]
MTYFLNINRFYSRGLNRITKALGSIGNLLIIALLLANCQTASLDSDQGVHDNNALQTYEESADKYLQLGDAYFAKGDFENAIGSWRVAVDKLNSQDYDLRQCKTFIKISKAYQAIGQASKALEFIDRAMQTAAQIKNVSLQAAGLSQKGSIYLGIGQAENAQDNLEQSLGLAKIANDPKVLAEVYTHLGILFTYQHQYAKAQKAYAQAITIYRQLHMVELQSAAAHINAAMAYLQAGQYDQAKSAADESLIVIKQTEDSHDKVFILINIGFVYQNLRPHLPAIDNRLLAQTHQIFNQAFEMANSLGDIRASSYALGYLGEVYAGENRYEEALQLTHRAIFAAQKIDAKEALFRWQWQAGRIYHQTNQIKTAITAYRLSITNLQSIQEAEFGCYGRFQSTVRQNIARISLELADLLLKQTRATTDPSIQQSLLYEAREVVELHKTYELRDYFQDDCVDAARAGITKLDDVSQTAVIIYPLILDDRMELLVSFPSGLKQFRIELPSEKIIETVRQFRLKLEKRTTREYLPYAQTLYDWLVGPFEPLLTQSNIDTLVFIPGGALRTIPFAALHDGNQFLISKYALAITPGLDLTDPQPIGGQDLKILAVGLTESVQNFPSLPFVAEEIQAIQREYPVTDLMVNENFSVMGLGTALKDEKFTIVHIASHAQFGRDVSDTFLLAYDDKLSLDGLDQSVGLLKYREDPLELLTLSACETAAGDDNAALGLAGVAVKSGARSALATLWHINDLASSILVGEFYHQLRDSKLTRAQALQRAQLKLYHDRRFQHPGYWSPFLLISNWL